jgi:hypothetical protein
VSPATPGWAAPARATRRAACAAALALACTAGLAGELWRCGPDGRTFTDRPCAEGEAIARAASPSARARAEAQAVAAREQLALQRLVAERHAREDAPWVEGRAAPAAIRPAASPDDSARRPRAHGKAPRKHRQAAGRTAEGSGSQRPAREAKPSPAKPRP